MASGRFAKTATYASARYLNNVNDSVIGGAITAAPSGLTVQQWQQNLPGDRIVLNPADALALSNNSVGNLYTGTYRYVAVKNNTTSNAARGRAAFWDPTATGAGNNISTPAADAKYQVTPDGNSANYTSTLMAGVFINAISQNQYGWIQETGKASLQFRAVITGTPAIGSGVYLISPAPANNNATDNGAFDVLAGANIGAGPIAAANFYSTIDQLLWQRAGIAETLPSNNNFALVNLNFDSWYRW